MAEKKNEPERVWHLKSTEQELLYELLLLARRQNRYLRSINLVVQILFLLFIIAVAISVCVALSGTASLF